MPYSLDLVLRLRGALATGEGEVDIGVVGTLSAAAISRLLAGVVLEGI
jgi:hypothetical protein